MADHAFEMDDRNSLKSKNLAAFQRDFPSLHKKLTGYTPAASLVVGERGEAHHAKDTYHFTVDNPILDEQVCDRPIQANFGGKYYTSESFHWTLGFLSEAIKTFCQGRQYFNCSDGALIEGAQPALSQTLSLPPVAGSKAKTVEGIIGNFPIYGRERLEEAWDEERIVKGINRVIDVCLARFGDATTFRDKRYLRDIMAFLPIEIGAERRRTNPAEASMAMLFKGTIYRMLIGLEYYLNRLADRGRSESFEGIVREEIAAGLERLRRDAIAELANLSGRAENGEAPVSAAIDEDTGRYKLPELNFRPPQTGRPS